MRGYTLGGLVKARKKGNKWVYEDSDRRYSLEELRVLMALEEPPAPEHILYICKRLAITEAEARADGMADRADVAGACLEIVAALPGIQAKAAEDGARAAAKAEPWGSVLRRALATGKKLLKQIKP
jgi:hypothetical protein